MLKKCLICLISVIVLTTVLGITACKLPKREEMRQPTYDPSEEAAIAQEVIDRIGLLFDNIRDGSETGDEQGQISQTFTESQLTALIAQKIESESDIINNVLVNINPDGILIAADLTNEGETKEVIAEFTFEANGDTVAMVLGDFTWGGLPVSVVPAAREKFEEQLNRGLQAALDDPAVTIGAIPVPDGATIDEIVLGEGQMTITGTITAEVLSR